MQRWLFFIIVIALGPGLAAQPVDILRTELSLWFETPFTAQGQVRAKAIVGFRQNKGADSLLFLSKGLLIQAVRQSEGRLKDSLPFFTRRDSLWVKTPEASENGLSELAFFYKIPLVRESVQIAPDFMAFNPFNLESGLDLGRAGAFYPSLPGDACFMQVNLTLPKEENSALPATLSFITDNGDGTVSHFWDSPGPISPEQFYLVIGKFEASQPEELTEELTFVQLDKTKLRAEKLRPRLAPFLSFLEEEASDSTLSLIDSLAHRPMRGFYLSAADASAAPAQFELEKSAALFYENDDTILASQRIFDYYRARQSEAWLRKIVESKWQNLDGLPEDQQKVTTRQRLGFWLMESGFATHLDSLRLDTALQKPMVESRKFPQVSVSYRYVSSDGAQHILYQQDTSLAPLYAIPALVTVINKKDTLRSYHFLDKAEGVVKVRTNLVPQYVDVDLGRLFPGRLSDRKPETYNLYLLSNARTTEARQRALLELFNTTNPNLFSTVLGIAMDDADATLRLKAVQRAGDLNLPARQKLKSTLLKLAENDPDSEVRAEAQRLTAKYYGSE